MNGHIEHLPNSFCLRTFLAVGGITPPKAENKSLCHFDAVGSSTWLLLRLHLRRRWVWAQRLRETEDLSAISTGQKFVGDFEREHCFRMFFVQQQKIKGLLLHLLQPAPFQILLCASALVFKQSGLRGVGKGNSIKSISACLRFNVFFRVLPMLCKKWIRHGRFLNLIGFLPASSSGIKQTFSIHGSLQRFCCAAPFSKP